MCWCKTESAAAAVNEQSLRQAASEAERSRATLHAVEGLALVMLCSSKPIIRKQAVHLLRESRNLFTVLNIPKVSLSLSVSSRLSVCHSQTTRPHAQRVVQSLYNIQHS